MTVALYLSGGATNSDPELSLGGAKSATLAYEGDASGLFGGISDAERLAGTVQYRMVYVESSTAATGLKLFVETETALTTTTVGLGWAVAGINETEAAIANELAAPPGVTFEEVNGAETATSGGDFAAGDTRGLWIRYTVEAGSLAIDEKFGLSYAVSADVPVNTVAPTVTGTPSEGSVLTAGSGTWTGTPTGYSYQWQQSSNGATGWTNINTATSTTLTAVQVDMYIRVRVIATNANGESLPAYSSPTTQIAGTTPVNTAVPVISGTVQEGNSLSATTGTWTRSPTSYTYSWKMSSNGVDNWSGAGGTTTLALTSTHVGKYIRLTLNASNASGSGTAVDSNVLGPIIIAVPVNTIVPTVSGSALEGATLTSNTGTWTKSPTSYAYQWQVSDNGTSGWTAIGGATASTFLVTSSQVGKYVRSSVIATNAGGAGTVAYSSALLIPVVASYTANPNHFGLIQGWASTTGGAGGTILKVVNLNASGTGSFRAAVEASGPRIIVFEVSGNIDMAGATVNITNPYFTIAGQTAPSPGITVIKGEFVIRTHNFIISHMKFRPGTGVGAGKDAMETQPGARNGIIYNCSFSWGMDGSLDIGGWDFSGANATEWRLDTSRNITLARNIIAEMLTAGSGATLLEDNSNDLLLYGNFWANNFTRNPLLKGGCRAALINNLIYNGQDKFVDGTLSGDDWDGEGAAYEEIWLDAIGNYAKAGPGTSSIAAFYESVSNHGTLYYYSDNIKLRTNGASYPEYVAVEGTADYNDGNYITVAGSPSMTGHGVTPIAASAVPAWVEASAGAFPWARDAIDARQFTHFNAGTWEGSYPSSQSYPASVNNTKTFVPAHWNLETMEPIHADALAIGPSTLSSITDSNSATNTVSDGAANGTAVGITAIATHSGYTVTYSLSDSAGGKFAISSTTGVVTKAGTLSFGSASSHSITVLATSSEGSTTSETFTIAVTSATAVDAVLVGKGLGNTDAFSATATTEASGNSYLVLLSWSSANISSLVDSKGNTYTLLGSVLTAGAGQKSAAYFCANGVGGADHYATVTFSGNTGGCVIHLIKITGAIASPSDVVAANTDGASPFTQASGVLAQANEVIVSFCASDSGANPATYACTGFTLLSSELDGAAYWTSAVAKQVVAATTSVTPSWTSTGATTANVHTLSFKGS
jgi:hypothetical protein